MEMRIFIILTRILLIGSYKLLIQNQKIMVLDVLQINNVQNQEARQLLLKLVLDVLQINNVQNTFNVYKQEPTVLDVLQINNVQNYVPQDFVATPVLDVLQINNVQNQIIVHSCNTSVLDVLQINNVQNLGRCPGTPMKILDDKYQSNSRLRKILNMLQISPSTSAGFFRFLFKLVYNIYL